MIKHPLTLASLLVTVLLSVMLAGCHIPFWPRLDIDSFPITDELVETMEVKKVVYVRVNNPAAADSSMAEPTLWIPASIYQSGKYVAASVNLPQPQKVAALPDIAADGNPAEVNVDSDYTKDIPTEEQLTESPPVILPLRRRALLFPTRITQIRPEIATLLSLELEKKLPLRVQESQDPALLEKGRLLLQPSEITREVKTWLKNSRVPASVQFVLFLTTTPGRQYQFYTCTWIDAQTGDNVATFTFRADLNGRLLLPLVPNHPTPLLRLIDSTTWWCKVKSRPEDRLYVLEAGHRSDLNYGRELKVFTKAVSIIDPKTKNHLGFHFNEPLGHISVIDFFAADGSLGQSRTPLSADFSEAWAVEVAAPPTTPGDDLDNQGNATPLNNPNEQKLDQE